MNKTELRKGVQDIFEQCPENIITKENAISPYLVGLTLFEAPLVGVASAKDSLFEECKKIGIVGPWYMGPGEWLKDAGSVVSIFFPFTERVRRPERSEPVETSPEWLHGRIEGQDFISVFTDKFCQWLREREILCCAPSIDKRIRLFAAGKGLENYPEANDTTFGSNWSERHAAYICGLGTFSLSRGIITQKGMAGRLSSVIVDVEFAPDERPYTGLDDYCIHCGACVKRCPARAISFEKGKEHLPCLQRLKQTMEKYAPRYGCGKCQTAVPCEFRRPVRIHR